MRNLGACITLRAYVQTHTCMHVRTRTRTQTHIHKCLCSRVCTSTYTHSHTHKHMCMHTQMHTLTHTSTLLPEFQRPTEYPFCSTPQPGQFHPASKEEIIWKQSKHTKHTFPCNMFHIELRLCSLSLHTYKFMVQKSVGDASNNDIVQHGGGNRMY
jgi:hypothetical protein